MEEAEAYEYTFIICLPREEMKIGANFFRQPTTTEVKDAPKMQKKLLDQNWPMRLSAECILFRASSSSCIHVTLSSLIFSRK
jgi:hypothetical protein